MKKFWVQCTNISVFVFVMLWCANAVTDLKFFSAFDPITQALTDFELTDIVFAELRLNPKVDTNIVVVNLAPTRRQIAQQVQIISSLNPKVIGIDSFFNCEGNLYDTINCPQLLDTLGNLLLGSAIEDAGNVVLVSKLQQKVNTTKNLNAIDVYDSIE
ncbi:MAG: hypothetical protein ACKO96_21725, partial [Flammeovirgaceae bacterium]